jgi:hypothetical protein
MDHKVNCFVIVLAEVDDSSFCLSKGVAAGAIKEART